MTLPNELANRQAAARRTAGQVALLAVLVYLSFWLLGALRP
ncbi:MAG: hypothetical protein AB7V26_10960 [Lysobacterales bacterium]